MIESRDILFMREALKEARRAARLGEVPVGALVVSGLVVSGLVVSGLVVSGDVRRDIIGRGHNLTIARHDPTAHAEVVALRRAARRQCNYRLARTTLYVTLEPCLLCLGAIVQARVGRVVYGAADPKRGAMALTRSRAVAGLLHHRFRITGGVLAEEGGALLTEFFRARR